MNAKKMLSMLMATGAVVPPEGFDAAAGVASIDAATREELLSSVWGYQFEGYERTVDVHIARLRRKLGNASQCIETVRGMGYRCKE